jgi:hypothetical protein
MPDNNADLARAHHFAVTATLGIAITLGASIWYQMQGFNRELKTASLNISNDQLYASTADATNKATIERDFERTPASSANLGIISDTQRKTSLARALKSKSGSTLATQATVSSEIKTNEQSNIELEHTNDQRPARMISSDQKSSEITLSCNGDETQRAIKLPHLTDSVRFRGKNCLGSDTKSPEFRLEILNQTNQFTGTVFFPTPANYISDYISIEPGTNTIQFSFENQKSQKRQIDYIIERE